MQKTMILTLVILMATSLTFGQGLMRRPGTMSVEERAKQEEQRKAEREAALPKMQAALKEIAGVTLGQPMSDALPEKNRGEWTNLQKPYRYFTKINPDYEFGKLIGVYLYFETDGKYSSKSLEAEVEATKKDVGERLGMKPDNESGSSRPGLLRSRWRGEMFNGWSINAYYNSELKAIVLAIRDQILSDELRKADLEAKEAKLATLPVFASGNPVNDTIEKEKIAKENARREAERKTEADARNAEREEQRKQLLAIQEELRRVRSDRSQIEVKKMVETGDMTSAIELCNRYKAESARAKKNLDRLQAMKEKATGLSPDALAIYRQKVDEAQKSYCSATNNLAQIEAMLTPAKRAELEQKKRVEDEKKARKAKAEAEFNAFEKNFSE